MKDSVIRWWWVIRAVNIIAVDKQEKRALIYLNQAIFLPLGKIFSIPPPWSS